MRRSPLGHVYALTKWNIFAIDDWRTVWMLMPKTASTSIRRSLAEHFDLPTGENEVHRIEAFQGLDKSDARRLQRQGYLVIGSTRHPLARLASCWWDKVGGGREYYAEFASFDEFRPGMPFVDFVDAVADIPDVDAEPHFRSMSFDLVDEQGVIPDLVIDQATLAQDWNRVRAQVAWRAVGQPWLPDLTRARAMSWRQHLGTVPRRTLVSLHRRYADDFAAFGYSPHVEASAELLDSATAVGPARS